MFWFAKMSKENNPKKIVSGEDYINSLRNRNLKVYLFGEEVEEPVDNKIIRPSINALAKTYDLALSNPELASVVSTTKAYTVGSENASHR